MVDAMWLAITQIEAQDMLNKMFLADWPNLKKPDRKKKHKELYALAFPKEMQKKSFVSAEMVQKMLAR